MTWQEPHAETVVEPSSPCAKDRKATITGTRPTAMKSQPRAVGVTPAGARLLQANASSTRLRIAHAMPKPRTHSLVVPIQPRGSGTPSSAAHAATGVRRAASAATRTPVFTPLFAARVVLEPLGLHFLGFLLVLFAEKPLAALVQVFGLEAFLLGHRDGVAVLAVLRGDSGVLRLLDHLRSGGRRDRRDQRQQSRGRESNELRMGHGRASSRACVAVYPEARSRDRPSRWR